MTTTLWVAAGIGALLVFLYVLWVFGLFRQSRELDGKIDYSKVREWKDDDRDT